MDNIALMRWDGLHDKWTGAFFHVFSHYTERKRRGEGGGETQTYDQDAKI